MLKNRKKLFSTVFMCLVFSIAPQIVNAQAPQHTLKFAHVLQKGHVMYEAMEYFAWLVNLKTGGKVEVKIFPGSQFGGETQAQEAVRAGAIDGTLISIHRAVDFVPEFGIFAVPYLFDSFQHAAKALYVDPRLTLEINKLVQKHDPGYKILAISSSGFRDLYNRIRPVVKVEDVKGMKIRTPPGAVEKEVWASFGALPVSLAYKEVYTGLSAGVIDAGENAPSGIFSQKFYEVAPFLSLTDHTIAFSIYVIGDIALKKLPEEFRTAIDEAAKEAAKYQFRLALTAADELWEKLAAFKGVTVSKVDKDSFRQKVLPLTDKLVEKLGAQEIAKIISDVGNR